MHFWCSCFFHTSTKTTHTSDSRIFEIGLNPECLNMYDGKMDCQHQNQWFHLRMWFIILQFDQEIKKHINVLASTPSLGFGIETIPTINKIIIYSLFERNCNLGCFADVLASWGSYILLQLKNEYIVVFYRHPAFLNVMYLGLTTHRLKTKTRYCVCILFKLVLNL